MKVMYHSFHKNINFDLKKKLNIKILKYIYFNIDNNEKKWLSSKSTYLHDFWRSCDTKAWSNDAENTALIIEIHSIFK